jgi:NADH-quinone oxidoreductase subunit I
MAIKKVDRKAFLNIIETVLFVDFIKGLSVTLKNLLRKPITTNYPVEKLTPQSVIGEPTGTLFGMAQSRIH